LYVSYVWALSEHSLDRAQYMGNVNLIGKDGRRG
jgi:hypothetical protein